MFEFPRFIWEVLIVGAVLIAIGLPITWVGMKIGGSSASLSTWISIAITFFVIGALTHTIFEATGMNHMYVKYYCK